MGEEKTKLPTGVGVLTILTVLLVLVLAIFSVLTLTTARADWSLSQTNAQAVRDYYAADAQAVLAERRFDESGGAEWEQTIPVNDAQSLYIHLIRTDSGAVERLAWQTVPTGTAEETAPLPVWDGTGLPG